MPYTTTSDNVQLYFEEAGSGTPILFIHEFAADYASWEPQLRYFSRSHRCITYSARGYIPPTSRRRTLTATSISATTRSRCSIT